MKKITLCTAAVAASLVATSLPALSGSCGAKAKAKLAKDKSSCPSTCSWSAKSASSKDIVDTAVTAGSFNTLVAAVKAAGLVDVLKGDGPFTVFAPSDEAFAKLPEGTVEELLKPENREKLQSILKYHVVAGKVTSKEVASLDSAKTVQGQKVSIKTAGCGTVSVDNAKVVKADIETSNGVIHVIDSVILPKES